MNPAHAALQNPALSALIKLEVSNYLLRIQLGEKCQENLEDRLNAVLSDNSVLMQRLAEKDMSESQPSKIKEESLDDAQSTVKVSSDVGDIRQRSSSLCRSNSVNVPETVPSLPQSNHPLTKSKSHRIVSTKMNALTLGNESSLPSGSGKAVDFSPPLAHVDEDDLNFFEMCEIGAHQSLFSGEMTFSSLHAAQVSNIYRSRDYNGDNNIHKESDAGPTITTAIKDIESFCFPNGVPVDIYAATAADLVSGASYDNYHVIRCTDQEGNVTYGCCITIIEKCKPMNALVEKNLVQLHGMRLASNTIKRCIRRYIAQKEHMRWSRTVVQTAASVKSSVKSESGRSSDGRSTPPQSGSFFRKMFSRRSTIAGTECAARGQSGESGGDLRKHSTNNSANSLPSVAEQDIDPVLAVNGSADNVTVGAVNGSPVVAKRRYSYFGYSTPQTATQPTPKGTPSSSSNTTPLIHTLSPSPIDVDEVVTHCAELSYMPTGEDDSAPRFRKAISICDLESQARNDSTPSVAIPSNVVAEVGGGFINNLVDEDHDDEGRSSGPRMRKSISICEPSDGTNADPNAQLTEKSEQDFPPVKDMPQGQPGCLPLPRLSTARSDVFHGDSDDDDDDNDIFRFSDSENENDSGETCGRDSNVNGSSTTSESSPGLPSSTRVKKGIALGKVIVTKKAYCMLSKKPLHGFLFKVLQKIVDTERLVYEDNERWLQEVSSDLDSSDLPSTTDGTLLTTICDMSNAKRNNWLHQLQSMILPSALLCIPSPLASSYLTDTELNTHAHGMRRIFDDNYNVMNLKNHGPTTGDQNFRGPDRRYLLARKQSSLWRYRPIRIDMGVKSPELKVNTQMHDPSVPCRDNGYVNVVQVDCSQYSALNPKMEISSEVSSFKEWSCSILFAVLSPTLVFKIMNLLLLEKSLVICGSDMGLVSAITSAAAEIITPFEWEGIFVPLMPYVAKDVLQAPVPYIVGTATMPKFDDLSGNAAVLYLDYKLGSGDVSCEECAWFVRIPEIDANMPVSDSLQKLLKVTQVRMSKYLPDSASRQNILELAESGKLYGGLGQANMFNTVTSPKGVRGKSTKTIAIAADGGSVSVDLVDNAVQNNKLQAMFGDPPKHHSPSRLLKTFLYNIRPIDKEAVARLMDAVTKHNIAFCGDAVQPGGWIQYCKYNKGTYCDEFNPQWFMQPRKAHTEFQEALVQTQMFVSHLDRLRIIYEKNSWQREFLSLWIYFKFHWRRKLLSMKS